MTEDEPLRRNTTVRVGLLADPGLPTELAEWLAEHLPRALREAVSDEVGWHVTTRSEPIPLDGDGQVPITDLAREHRGAQEWDLLLVLTDLPRRIGTNPLASAFWPEVRAGLVSVPALGAVGVRSRAMAIALRLVGRLAGPVLDEAGVSPARSTSPRRPVLDPTRPTPSDASEDGAELALVGLRGRLRLLTGMVRANRPWRLVPQLSSATAAAVATAAYASVTVSFWQMAAALSPTRLILINLLAVGAMTVWLIAYNRLWDRPADPAERVKAVLYNAATVLTLLVGVVCMNMLLFLVMLVAAAALIDPGYLAQTVHQPAVLDVYLQLVWLGSSIGIVAGALGSSLESEEAVRNATYGARERERRRAQRPVSEDTGVR